MSLLARLKARLGEGLPHSKVCLPLSRHRAWHWCFGLRIKTGLWRLRLPPRLLSNQAHCTHANKKKPNWKDPNFLGFIGELRSQGTQREQNLKQERPLKGDNGQEHRLT